MYKLLLVDDEPEIREGLREVVDFAALGFEIVGEAGNGLQALHLAQELRPDLIITDIRMPLMDGLTMAARVRDELPNTQFIILSGYDEFDYARQAIEVTALRYILKPISSAEFIEMMGGVRARMDDEHARRRDLINLRAHFQASLPMLREMLFTSLMTGAIDAQAAIDTARRYGMALESPAYALALMRLPEGEPASAIDDPALLSVAIENITQEVLDGRQAAYHAFHMNGLLALLLLLPDGDYGAMAGALSALEDACGSVEHYLRCQVQVGVSAPCAGLSALPGSARQALSALNHAQSMGGAQVLCITDMVPDRGHAITTDEYTLRLLGNALKSGDGAQATAALASLLGQEDIGRASIQEYSAYLLEILMVFIRTARDLDLVTLDDDIQAALEKLMHYPPLPQARQLLGGLCGRFMRGVADTKATSARLLAQQAQAYMQAHYMDESLNVNQLCAHLHISPSYFSALFKRETQQTFLQYLNALRMDKAMTLLSGSDLRTAEIAGRVGISDPSYFSYAFKRQFGFSPSHVRGRGRSGG